MANMDAKLVFCTDKAVGASVTSDVVDLGAAFPNVDPLYVNVKLSTGNSAGTVTGITLQVADDEAFTSPVEVCEYKPLVADQSVPCSLADFKAPINPTKRYCRLVFAGSDDVAGGKITAYMAHNVQVRG